MTQAGEMETVADDGQTGSVPQRTAYPGGRWVPPPATYGVTQTLGVGVTMSDGAQIVADIWAPANLETGAPVAEKFPVLLTRTPYSGTPAYADLAARSTFFVERGYIFVSADIRGSGRSSAAPGGGYFNKRDAQDGAELVAWAVALPASSGVVGLVGCSALGVSQLTTAAVLGPDSPVKAMVPSCVPGDQYRDTFTEGGVWRSQWDPVQRAFADLAPGWAPELLKVYVESQTGGDATYRGDYWHQRDHVAHAKQIIESGAAVLLWTGWQDFGFGGLELFAALQKAAAMQGAAYDVPITEPTWSGEPMSGRYQLILGDWLHGGGRDPGVELQWFDTWLKCRDTGIPTETSTPFHIQDRVTKEWVNLDGYPMTNRYTPLYLGPATLSLDPTEPGADEIAYGPPELGNSLDYTGEPFTESARLAGPIAVRLISSSSNTDALFRVDLDDIDRHGLSQTISHGMIVGSMHQLDPARSWRDAARNPIRPFQLLKSETPIAPGERINYEIHLAPTMWTIRPGHRLRLTVTTSPPLEESTLGPIVPTRGCRPNASVLQRLVGGKYTIYRGGGARFTSMISLPLMPVDRLSAVHAELSPTGTSTLPVDW